MDEIIQKLNLDLEGIKTIFPVMGIVLWSCFLLWAGFKVGFRRGVKKCQKALNKQWPKIAGLLKSEGIESTLREHPDHERF